MLRLIFISAVMLVGIRYAIRDAFGALLLYLWIAYFRPEYWAYDTAFLISLNLSLLTGLYLLIRALLSGASFRVDFRSAVLVLILALSLASTLTSAWDEYAWPWWINFAKALTIAYLISVLVTDVSQFRIVILVIAVSLGLEGAKQGWIGLLIHPGGRNDNTYATLGDNNGVAVGMLMLVPVFVALAKTAQYPWERRFHQFLMIGITYRAISTYSRGGFLAAGAMAAIYVLRSRQKLRAAVGTVLVAGIVLSVLPSEFWERMSTIPASQEGMDTLEAAVRGDEGDEPMDESAASRIHYWRVAVDMAVANPLLGVGLNAFSRFYNQYDSLNGLYGYRRSVHSIWFGILAELGIPAFLLFLTTLGLAIVGCSTVARRALKGDLPAEYYSYAVALQAAFAACLVGGTFLPFQYNEMLWHFVGLSMALRAIAMKATVTSSAGLATPYSALGPRRFQSARAT